MIKKRTIWPYLLAAPAVLIILCVVFILVFSAVVMSFQKYDLYEPKDTAFNGVANYMKASEDPLFWNALWRTVVWVAAGAGLQFLFRLILALLLNRKFVGHGMVRAVSTILWVTPGVLIGLVWRWIYNGNFGVFSDLLLKIYAVMDKIPFLSQVSTTFPSVIVTIVWQGIPFFALMLLATLQGVPAEMYEAADIDGASPRQELMFVTIPSIKNIISVAALLHVIWVANSVDVIYDITEGRPAYSTQTLSVYIFSRGNALKLGYASAMTLLMVAVLLVVAIPYLKMDFREEK